MTLKSCQVLLKHFQDIVSGARPPQEEHRNWDLVMKQAKEQVAVLTERIERKSSATFKKKHGIVDEVEEKPKPVEKKTEVKKK